MALVMPASRRRVVSALILVLCAAAGNATPQDPPSPTEQEVKAAYLYNFAKYVEWPPQAPAGATWVVGILGDGDFGETLKRALEGKTARDRSFEARRLSDATQASQVHILFIGASEEPRLPSILKSVAGASVLTVSDIQGFAERGGVIGFRMDGNRVRFDINPDHASRSGLRISSQLLTVARVVPAR